jgi:dienelactone hydrolase
VLDRLRLGEVPALAAHAGDAAAAAERGAVLVYHPLGADKSLHEEDLERLARAGFLAVGVDAIAHGERRVPGAYARFRADPFGALLQVVTGTADEVPGIVDRLVARGWARPGRIGIVGVSLGGFIAYGAAIAERRIAAAVCVAASPDWGPDPRSPHRAPERFFPLALLSITAAADPLVPPGAARALHLALAPRYAGAPERLRLVELPDETHRMTMAGWARARGEAERWLERFVARAGDATAGASP